MYGLLIQEIARGRVTKSACAAFPARNSVAESSDGHPSTNPSIPSLGVDPLHGSAHVLRFGSEPEPRVEALRVASSETHPADGLQVFHDATHEELAPPAAVLGQHEHVSDPREPAAVGHDARRSRRLRPSGRGATCTGATTRRRVRAPHADGHPTSTTPP